MYLKFYPSHWHDTCSWNPSSCKTKPISHSRNHGCWWPNDARNILRNAYTSWIFSSKDDIFTEIVTLKLIVLYLYTCYQNVSVEHECLLRSIYFHERTAGQGSFAALNGCVTVFPAPTLIARFMGPTRGPSGPHEPCYLGMFPATCVRWFINEY